MTTAAASKNKGKHIVVSVSSSEEEDDESEEEEEDDDSDDEDYDDAGGEEDEFDDEEEEEEREYESMDGKPPDDEVCNKVIDLLRRRKSLDHLKLEECKAYLKKHELRLSGTKATCLERILEHWRIKHGNGEEFYPRCSFCINCTGDVCQGDVILFKQKVYQKFNIVRRSADIAGRRTVAGRVVKESYGADKQQHTFTVEVLWSKGVKALPPLFPMLVKGRNLYRLKTFRQHWQNEAARSKVLAEKHKRGAEARHVRAIAQGSKRPRKSSKKEPPPKKRRKKECEVVYGRKKLDASDGNALYNGRTENKKVYKGRNFNSSDQHKKQVNYHENANHMQHSFSQMNLIYNDHHFSADWQMHQTNNIVLSHANRGNYHGPTSNLGDFSNDSGVLHQTFNRGNYTSHPYVNLSSHSVPQSSSHLMTSPDYVKSHHMLPSRRQFHGWR
ncbi:uncharacterized protein [Typha latifolia]|uniref:uncharacterized protein n=1 Tax=Typha latifolia TaxID=4733 RepID=UPI003C302D5A